MNLSIVQTVYLEWNPEWRFSLPLTEEHNMNVNDLQAILNEICVSPEPNERWCKRASVFSRVEYAELGDECKCHLAAFFIEESCSYIGAVQCNGDVMRFLANVMDEAKGWPEGTPVNNRRLEHILYAMRFSGAFTESEGALAATYLLTQLEYVFRLLSTHLDPNGKFKSEAEKKAASAAIGESFPMSIYRINWAYQILLLNQTTHAARCFLRLDNILRKPTMPNGLVINHIGDRLAYMRNPAAHGARSDISSEGMFYALLTAIALFGGNVFERKA